MTMPKLLDKSLITIFIIFNSLATFVLPLPFIVFQGISDTCDNKKEFIKSLEKGSNSHGYCIGHRSKSTAFVPLMDQVALVCKQVKGMDDLKNGYHLIGLSQGGLVARGVIEFCDEAPPVENFISLGSSQAGLVKAPTRPGSQNLNTLSPTQIYSEAYQNSISVSNYLKIPTSIDVYLRGCKYLPYVNNETPSARNATYKERFSSLNNLVLVMFEEDTMIIPKESSWFGYYPDGSNATILPFNETTLYKEDWIGLKRLHEAGKVTMLKAPGGHVNLSHALVEMILPFLKDFRSEQFPIAYS